MPQVFVDTAFWVALMGPDDDWHERARVLDRRHIKAVLTTDDHFRQEQFQILMRD